MPVNTPGIKVESVRKLGGTVELVGESYQETQVGSVGRRWATRRRRCGVWDAGAEWWARVARRHRRGKGAGGTVG